MHCPQRRDLLRAMACLRLGDPALVDIARYPWRGVKM